MKNIKQFKYKNTYNFDRFLKDYGYTLDDVEEYSLSSIKRYHGNILKIYKVYVYDGESVYFSVVYFKSLNELDQSRLGFKGDKLLKWYEDANIRKYKVKDIWGMDDKYVIAF